MLALSIVATCAIAGMVILVLGILAVLRPPPKK